MNHAVANRLARLGLDVEAANEKLDEVLALLRPIATPVPVIRYRGEEIPVDAQAVVVDRVLGALDPGRVVLPWAMGQHGAEVVAALSEFGYTPTPDASAGDAVRAALHAERRARDAANIDAGEARAEAAALRKELADELVAREELAGELNRALDVSVRRQVAAEHLAANMDRTIEAVDGKLDEVLRLLRPIASGEIPVDAQADVAARILGQFEGPDSAAAAIHTDVAAVLSEFGHGVDGGTCADSVRAALHAERRARDAANIDAGEARAEAGLRLRERDDAREDAAMWRSHTEFLARVFPGGPVEITRDGQCVTIANTPGRRRWWGRRRR